MEGLEKLFYHTYAMCHNKSESTWNEVLVFLHFIKLCLLETKRKKIKKRNVPKLHQKATVQPDALGVQAGKAAAPWGLRDDCVFQ